MTFSMKSIKILALLNDKHGLRWKSFNGKLACIGVPDVSIFLADAGETQPPTTEST